MSDFHGSSSLLRIYKTYLWNINYSNGIKMLIHVMPLNFFWTDGINWMEGIFDDNYIICSYGLLSLSVVENKDMAFYGKIFFSFWKVVFRIQYFIILGLLWNSKTSSYSKIGVRLGVIWLFIDFNFNGVNFCFKKLFRLAFCFIDEYLKKELDSQVS